MSPSVEPFNENKYKILMDGEVFPDNNAMEVYKYAYSILAAILKKMF